MNKNKSQKKDKNMYNFMIAEIVLFTILLMFNIYKYNLDNKSLKQLKRNIDIIQKNKSNLDIEITKEKNEYNDMQKELNDKIEELEEWKELIVEIKKH